MNDNEIALTFLKLESGSVNQATNPITSKTSAPPVQHDEPTSGTPSGSSKVAAKHSKKSESTDIMSSSQPAVSKIAEGEFSEFLRELFSSLVSNKEIPKYQFERRIDTILELFLPEFLSKKFGGEATFVVPEFPLKKIENNQSNNVDYLFYLKRPFAAIDKWLLCELKTDDDSINLEQLQLYSRAKTKGMKLLLNDVMYIRNASVKKSKYDILIDRLKPFASDKPMEIVYFVLTDKDLSHLRTQYPDIEFIGIEELKEFEPVKYGEVWKMFCEMIMKS